MEVLWGSRLFAGWLGAGGRVAGVAFVRARYVGRGMARVMSLIMTVFMVVPILAPGLGQIVLIFLPWRWCFGVLVVASVLLLSWIALRFEETLAEPVPLSARSIASAYGSVLRHRVTPGYMLARGRVFAALFAFLPCSVQHFR